MPDDDLDGLLYPDSLLDGKLGCHEIQIRPILRHLVEAEEHRAIKDVGSDPLLEAADDALPDLQAILLGRYNDVVLEDDPVRPLRQAETNVDNVET